MALPPSHLDILPIILNMYECVINYIRKMHFHLLGFFKIYRQDQYSLDKF